MPARRVPASALLVCLVALAGCRPLGVAPGGDRSPRAAEPVPSRQSLPALDGPAAAPVRALTLLHRWDARRAAAYRSGSAAGLRDLYVPGCGAGRADVRLLRSYAARGYRVRGLRMQVLGLRVLAHRPGRWRLEVTDRLAYAVAVGHGGRTALPRDQASTRVVKLVRGPDGQWRVAAVVPR